MMTKSKAIPLRDKVFIWGSVFRLKNITDFQRIDQREVVGEYFLTEYSISEVSDNCLVTVRCESNRHFWKMQAY